MRSTAATAVWLAACLVVIDSTPLRADDQPQWGRRHTRNMVSSEKNLPDGFDAGRRNPDTGEIDLATTKNVKWVVRLGSQSCGTPVVAGGKIFVGTNNDAPRDARNQGDRGVMMCFDEATGKLLWQLVVPKLLAIKNSDWQYIGLTSTPAVENQRAYLVSNRGEVLCLDVEGMANGNDGPYTDEGRHMVPPGRPPLEPGPNNADIIWLYDMVAELGVCPHNSSNCSILVDGDLLYVCTSNGVEHTHNRVNNPAAPTLIVVHKKTGKLVARDDFGIGIDIIHGQWCSPALGRIGEKRLVFFGAGNGHLYAVAAIPSERADDWTGPLKNVWRFNGNPLAQTRDHVPIQHGYRTPSFEVIANPVVYKNRVYLTFTQDCWHGGRSGFLACIDATKTGVVTRSALRWSYDRIGSCSSTVSISDGLLYIAEYAGRLHCLDAETGKCYWVHEAGGPIWGSTLVADGKVYLGTGRLNFWVLAAGKELKVINRIRLRDRMFASPVAANGVLYVTTNKHLYAVAK